MNDFFTVYKKSTGEIIKTLFIPVGDIELNFNKDADEDYLNQEGRYEYDYVLNGVVTKRPENPTALNGLVLSDVPKGSTIYIDGSAYEVEPGGEIQLQFNQAGSYSVQIESFPYLDKEFIVDYQP